MALADSASWLFTRSVLTHDFRAFVFAYLGCSIASTVSVFQFAVFPSFLAAAYVPVSFIGADLWIMGRGVKAFDFAYPVSADLGWTTAKCAPDARLLRVASGFTTYQGPTGNRGSVMLIGFDSAPIPTGAFMIDESDIELLELSASRDAEIGRQSMTYAATTDRLKTFLGSPYAISSFRNAATTLPLPRDLITFLAIELPAAQSDAAQALKTCVQSALGDAATVRTRAEFERSSALYWLMKTGAGAAILIASILAAILTLVILINGISRLAQRHFMSLISMIGHGADERDLSAVMGLLTAALVGLTLLTTLVCLPILDGATNFLVPWVDLKATDLIYCFALLGIAALSGLLVAHRQIQQIESSALFRV